MTVTILTVVSIAACLLAFGWAREHRLRRALQIILTRLFRKDQGID